MTNCENYIRSLKLQTPDLQTISLKSKQLLLEGQQYVDIRFSLVKEVDPETVLFEGEQEGKHARLSPIGTLRTAFTYLEELSYKYQEETPPNTQYITISTLPDRKRSTPESVATDGPITGIFKPFTESTVTYMPWHPMHCFVVGVHFFLDSFNINKPC